MVYGYAPPPPRQPPVDRALLRPRRFWYAIAGAVAALGVAAGVALFVVGLMSMARNLPTVGQTFGGGDVASVTMSTGQNKAIYGAEGSFDAKCRPVGAGANDIVVERMMSSFQLTDEGPTWHELYTVRARNNGTYTITCQGSEATYAVGEAPEVGKFVGNILGSLAAFFLLPLAGAVAGAVVALVVWLRRDGHRKRLQAAPGSSLAPYLPRSG